MHHVIAASSTVSLVVSLHHPSFIMDDLLDLSWSDKPIPKAHIAPSTSRQATPTFNFLSTHEASTPPLRGTTPQTAPLSSRLQTPRSATPNSDAFSSLLSLAPVGHAKTLSLAERQLQAEKERQEKEDRQRAQFTANGSFWDNLGSSSKAPSAPSIISPQPLHAARPSAVGKTSSTPQDIWDDDDTFLSGPSKPTAAQIAPSDPFDFDAFNETMNAPAKPVATESPNEPSRPSKVRCIRSYTNYRS